MKPTNDFHIFLWFVLIATLCGGCTTGVGYLWKEHKNREFMATHHVVGDHWEENKK